MKNFEEKEIKDFATVNGGRGPEIRINFSINSDGWFDGSMNLFDGIKGNTEFNEFDDGNVAVAYKL